MKISIITPCFNAEKTIKKTIESVLVQQHEDLEYLIIDGGSRDSTVAIANEYHNRIDQLISEQDHGIYDAMNKGLDLATGEVIAFLNADDHYATPQILSAVAAAMADHSVDAVFGDVSFFNPEDPSKSIRRYSSRPFSPQKIGYGWMPAQPSLFLRRSIFEYYGRFKTDYKIAADFEFCARIFKNNQIRYHYIPEVFVKMQTGGVSTSGLQSTITLNREVLRACRENGIHTNYLKLMSKYLSKIFELVRR